MYKIPSLPSPGGGGKFIKSIGEEYQVVKRGREYLFPFDIKAVEKNVKWGRGPENLGKKIKILKMRERMNIKL